MTKTSDEVVSIVTSSIEQAQGSIPSLIRRQENILGRAAKPSLPKTTYTVKAVVPNLIPKGLPLFSYAVGGCGRDGVHVVALVEAESPAAAVATLQSHFSVVDVLSVAEGVVGIQESWTWLGFLPTEEAPRGFWSRLFGWFR